MSFFYYSLYQTRLFACSYAGSAAFLTRRLMYLIWSWLILEFFFWGGGRRPFLTPVHNFNFIVLIIGTGWLIDCATIFVDRRWVHQVIIFFNYSKISEYLGMLESHIFCHFLKVIFWQLELYRIFTAGIAIFSRFIILMI